jgi:hypothetical protein
MEVVMANSDPNGFAVAGAALAQSLLESLRAKGVLTDVEADEVIETALAAIENVFPADDPRGQQARALLEAIGDGPAAGRRPQSQ